MTAYRGFHKILLVILAGVMSAALCGAAHAGIDKGPYVQNLTKTSVTICWESDNPGPGTVEYSLDPQGETKSLESEGKSKFHEVTITGLTPGTPYRYRVTADGERSAGAFRTAPDQAEPFRFAVIGDTRTGHPLHKQLITHMKKHDPALILNSGDLVGDGRQQPDWDMFWDITTPIARSVPYYPCLGNHEKNSDLYFQYFSLPQTGDGEKQYTFSYAGAWYIVLDTNSGYATFPQQKKWLTKALQIGQKYDFIFVLFHNPVYSSSDRDPNTNLQAVLTPLFEKYGVSAVFNGHDHFYERSMKNGIPYIISGGGGAPLYDPDHVTPESVVRAKTNQFMIVEINGKKAVLKTFDINNKVIDELTVNSPR